MENMQNSAGIDPSSVAQQIAACEMEIQKGMIGQREIIRQVMLILPYIYDLFVMIQDLFSL